MRYFLLAVTVLVSGTLVAWGVDVVRPDALDADALDAVRVGFAIAVIACWCPMVLATWYAFRCRALEKALHVASADRVRRMKR